MHNREASGHFCSTLSCVSCLYCVMNGGGSEKKQPWKTFHNKLFSVTYVKQYRHISCRVPGPANRSSTDNNNLLFTHKKRIKMHSSRAESARNTEGKKRDNFNSCCHWIVTIIAFRVVVFLTLFLSVFASNAMQCTVNFHTNRSGVRPVQSVSFQSERAKSNGMDKRKHLTVQTDSKNSK